MSVLPPSAVASVAQTQLAQAQRSAEVDAPRDADARRSEKQRRRRAGQHEFVEDMAAAQGLKVDPDGRGGSGGSAKQDAKLAKRGKGRQSPPVTDADIVDAGQPATAPTEGQADVTASTSTDSHDARARSAALLADPGAADKAAPPPYMLDIEA